MEMIAYPVSPDPLIQRFAVAVSVRWTTRDANERRSALQAGTVPKAECAKNSLKPPPNLGLVSWQLHCLGGKLLPWVRVVRVKYHHCTSATTTTEIPGNQ